MRAMSEMTAALRAELAPSGRLRVGLNYGNFLLVLKDDADGAPRGIAPDLARELGRRVGAPVEFVRYDQAGTMADAVTSGAWDVAFLAAEPARANVIAFTAAYLEIEAGYLVPPGSPIRTIDEVDRPGVRIAVANKAAYDLYLSRTLKHAELVRAEGIPGSYDLFVTQKLDALSGLKPRLLMDVERLPGARILDGRFTAIQQGIGTPVARAAAAAYLRAFVEEIKSSGLVAQAIARHGVRGVNVAPPAA
jgi:polar amino acid transport system substrate-binding protein